MADALFPAGAVTLIGVLNATPDSFSDGGALLDAAGAPDLEAVVAAGRRLHEAGAGLLDVGGESTRPGAETLPAELEIARTRPVIEALAKALPVPLSIDTRKAPVAEAALAAGASVINDVSGLQHDPELAGLAARSGAGLILGHLRGSPARMQRQIHFEDVLNEVAQELQAAGDRARAAGVADDRLALDPGIGFGKELPHNLELLANVGVLRRRLGLPVCVGPSRKSFLGALTGDPVEARDAATHAACAVAVFAGADAVRVHDVAGARRAVQVALALRAARRDPA